MYRALYRIGYNGIFSNTGYLKQVTFHGTFTFYITKKNVKEWLGDKIHKIHIIFENIYKIAIFSKSSHSKCFTFGEHLCLFLFYLKLCHSFFFVEKAVFDTS